jgi:hypothetical protein
VLEEAKSIEFTEPEEGEDGGTGPESREKPIEDDTEEVKKWLEDLKPDDFLKFEN